MRFFVVRSGEPIDAAAVAPAIQAIPLAPPPREARLRTKVRIGTSVVATVVAALGVVLFLLAMHHGRALERLRDGGLLVVGRVENLRVTNSGRSKTRTITYSFDHDGTSVRAAQSVSSATFERFSTGDPIEVTYERADPSNHQLFKVGEREVSEFWTATSIASAAYCAIALVAAFAAFTVYRRRLALLRDGKLIDATIAKIGRFSRKKQGRKVQFTFTAPTGEEVTRRHWMPQGAIEPGQEGQSVGYLVAPDDEKRGEPVVVVLGSCELL
jgi:hypothetical protein